MPGRATATDDHVCVIGAGPAGLAVAAALHQVGIPVVVLERGTGPPSSGTALGLWTNAWRALDALHAAEELRAQYREVSLCVQRSWVGVMAAGTGREELQGLSFASHSSHACFAAAPVRPTPPVPPSFPQSRQSAAVPRGRAPAEGL